MWQENFSDLQSNEAQDRILEKISGSGGLTERWLAVQPCGQKEMDVKVFLGRVWGPMPVPLGMGGFLSRKLAQDRLEMLDFPLLWDQSDHQFMIDTKTLQDALGMAYAKAHTPKEILDGILQKERGDRPRKFASG